MYGFFSFSLNALSFLGGAFLGGRVVVNPSGGLISKVAPPLLLRVLHLLGFEVQHMRSFACLVTTFCLHLA